MKRFTLLLAIMLFVSSFGVYAQESESQDNEIFFVQRLQPHNDQIEAFEKAVQEHNNKFHSEEGVSVFYEISGEYHGHYQFVMAPYTWTEWENRETSEAHDKHWRNTIMPLVKHSVEPSAWQRLPKYELNPVDSQKSIITILTIKQGENARFMRALEKWHEANKEAENYDGSYNVFSRQLSGENQVAIVSSLEDGWAELDEENNFRDRFEEEHGKTAWDLWSEDATDAIKSEDVITRVFMPELSAGN